MRLLMPAHRERTCSLWTARGIGWEVCWGMLEMSRVGRVVNRRQKSRLKNWQKKLEDRRRSYFRRTFKSAGWWNRLLSTATAHACWKSGRTFGKLRSNFMATSRPRRLTSVLSITMGETDLLVRGPAGRPWNFTAFPQGSARFSRQAWAVAVESNRSSKQPDLNVSF